VAATLKNVYDAITQLTMIEMASAAVAASAPAELGMMCEIS